MFLCVLAGLENLVTSPKIAPYLRVFSWWICLQHWGTLRFSDHRGISPSSVSFQGIDFVSVLTHSKTIGKDKRVQSRPVVVHGLSFLAVPDWLRVGWEVLKSMADFQRDYLLPTPSSCLKGCLRAELRYDTGSAIFYRVLGLVKLPGEVSIPASVAHYWTPHSGRAFLPSYTAALKVEKTTRDFLGGWNAQGSDRYSRIARLRIFNMQKAVLQAIRSAEGMDPAFESEALQEFVEFLNSCHLAEEAKTSLVRAMETRPKLPQHQPSLSADELVPEDAQGVVPYLDEEWEIPVAEPLKKKRGGHAQVRTAELGTDPRTKRAQLRSAMLPGFYLCFSGKKSVKTLHKLGSCYALPGIDYLRYEYLGEAFPSVATFDTICKLCGRNITNPDADSDVPFTSSSSSEGKQ